MRLSAFTAFILSLFVVSGNLSAQYDFNVKRTFGETNHKIVFASYNSDGSLIVTAGSDSSIIVWNTDRSTIYRTISGLDARPNVAGFSIDNKYVLSGGKDNKVTMWDLGSIPTQLVRTFEGHRGQIKSLDVSPDGDYLATGSADGSVRIWNIHNSDLVYDLKGHSKDVNAVVYSPDGGTLASGGADGVLVLWNTLNGSKIISKKGHKGWIRDIEFSPGGDLLASCGDDKLINTWRIPGLENYSSNKGLHKDWIQTIDISPDSRIILSGGRDRFIRLSGVTETVRHLSSAELDQVVISLDIHPVKTDFITACYGSETLETWVISGPDEAQWAKPSISAPESAAIEQSSPDSQERIKQEENINNVVPPTGPVPENSMIELFTPVPVQGRIMHDQSSIDLVGRASDPEGISIFLINKNVVQLPESGVFQYKLDLATGENALDLVVVNNKGKMSELKLVIYCSAEGAQIKTEQGSGISKGQYYALLIGINDYEHPEINDLDKPINDAESLYQVLVSRYTFEEENMYFLKNPTQAELITVLDDFTRNLTPEDNLLIFFAGHGYWDKKGNVGYWFPADASRNSTVNWFRNSTLRDFIGSIEAKHTLLIADACFSGAIFKTRGAFSTSPTGIEKLHDLPSRKAMTSGILEEVPDESVFLKYLVQRLEENEEQFLTSEFLFSSVKTPVMNNSPNIPQFGVIQNVGDEGGDFVFIIRE